MYHYICGIPVHLWRAREKKMSRYSAVKVLNHAMQGSEGTDNCNKFVDILGLRSIFPLFMKTPKTQKKSGALREELEGIYARAHTMHI